jgi:small-conductance mechanosensitive channel
MQRCPTTSSIKELQPARAQEKALERVVLPLSGLASWLIVVTGALSCLHVLGINVAPLLTVGGLSGILVGLSAQSVMANMVAGINLVSIHSTSANPIHDPKVMLQGVIPSRCS